MRAKILYYCAAILLPGLGAAQCPTVNELTNRFKVVCQSPLTEQYQELTAWRKQWDQCRYGPDSIYVNALLQMGQVYSAKGDLTSAEHVIRQAVAICSKNTRSTRVADLAKAWYRLGVTYTFQKRIVPAMNALKQAVAIGGNGPMAAVWVGNAHLYLAYAYETAGDFQQTLAHAEVGIPMAFKLDNKPLAANLLRQKAQALSVLQDYDKAQEAITEAINLIKQNKELEQALSDNYSLLSLILGYRHQYRQALQYAQLSFDLAQDLQYDEAPNMAIRLGYLYNKINKPQEAIQYCQYGIDHSRDPFVKAVGFNVLGTVYWQKGQFSKALSTYQRGIKWLPIGFNLQDIYKNPTAKQMRSVAYKGILLTLMQDKADTWLDFAKQSRNNKHYLKGALLSYQAVDQLVDLMRWDHTAQESKLYWRDKTRDIYERAIETCYKLDDAEQAFRFFEKSRAVMLADKLNELGARQQLSETQSQKEKALREAVSHQQQDLAALTPDSARYKSVSNALNEKQDKLDTFIKELEASNPTYFRYKYDTTTAKLAELQRYLTVRKSSFVTYFVGDSALYLLSVAGGKATLLRQSIGHYRQTTQACMALLASADAMNRRTNLTRFITLGNELYQQLLTPLHLPKGSLIISPDGVTVPFETLSLSATKPAYLLNEYAFSYVYSARRLTRGDVGQTRTNLFADIDFLGVAPVTFAPALGQVSLFGSDKALEPIAGRFRSSMLLTHQAASCRAFLTQAANARIVHLFTHASADSTESEPTLYFADSTLQLSDLGDDGLPHVQLVVLAACKTGVGADQRGEGVFSLARGFAALGVPSILTTLWSVENKATYEITDLFYKHLDEGLSKDVALQLAKQDWLKQSENSSPTQWAGLILIGDTQPLDRSNRWFWIAGGGLLLGLLAFLVWYFRRRYGPSSTLSYGRLT